MKIFSHILYGIFITLLVGVGALLLVSLVPMTGNIEIKIVKSGSMAPAIKTGSVVVVKPEGSYRAGDVITFGKDTARDIPTTHRIVATRETPSGVFYSTKGDANEEGDPKEVAARDVIGKVLVAVPYAGFVLDFARQPLGFALLIGLPALMIILDESITIGQEFLALKRRRKNKVPAIAQLEVPKKPHIFRKRIPTI